jgi:hypothetical protein
VNVGECFCANVCLHLVQSGDQKSFQLLSSAGRKVVESVYRFNLFDGLDLIKFCFKCKPGKFIWKLVFNENTLCGASVADFTELLFCCF